MRAIVIDKHGGPEVLSLAERPDPAVFVLWGNYAKKKLPLIDEERHVVVQGAHPSPLSAKKFFGSRYTPPNQLERATSVTPSTPRMRFS